MRCLIPIAAVVLTPLLLPAQALNIPWSGYGHDPQHTGTSATSVQSLANKHWQTPVDLNPPGSGPLLVHYGSPVITAANTVIVPVTTAASGYQLQAFNGSNGSLIYTLPSDYKPPQNNTWIAPYGPALAVGMRLYYAGAGGTLYFRDLPDSAAGPNGQTGATGQVAFYGMTGPTGYSSDPAGYNNAVHISTPLTADRYGDVFFGFVVSGANNAQLVNGIARITSAGTGTWVSAISLTGDSTANLIAQNCAPALSNAQDVVYIATSDGSTFGTGYLTSMNAATLAPIAHVALNDPRGQHATVSLDSSAAPMVGPDGDVYFGVLEGPCCSSHGDRGWLLHFNSTLTQTKTPGSFGWDDTASVVPAFAVPSYSGSSSYLVLTKYNDYANTGGSGINQVAILDPFSTQPDEYSGGAVSVMKEILTVNGVTPDPALPAVREWCINAAAVDPFTKSAIVNSEDGVVYRWDFTSNTLQQRVVLTSGRGEAYTPTMIGADGTAYAVNDAVLFAVGN